MPVAVKQVRNMEQWTKDVFWVFLREVEILRSAIAISVCLSLSVSVCLLSVFHLLISILYPLPLSSLTSQLQCPCVVQFLGATIDCQHKACAILTEYMARKSLDVVLHVKKTPLDWNTRLRIVGVVK